MCTAASRLLVHEDIHDRFVDELAARAKKLRVGNPLDPASQMGSQISVRQMDRILDYIESGKQEGARLRHAAASAMSTAIRRRAFTSSPRSSPTSAPK